MIDPILEELDFCICILIMSQEFGYRGVLCVIMAQVSYCSCLEMVEDDTFVVDMVVTLWML